MRYLNRFVMLVAFCCSPVIAMAASGTVSNLTVKELKTLDGHVMVYFDVNQSMIDAYCSAPETETKEMYLFYSVDPTTQPLTITNKDEYKMMWSTLSSAIALGRQVSVGVESISDYFPLCFIKSVSILSENPSTSL